MTTCRLATPADAEAFAGWAALNPDIPREDILAAISHTNITVVVEVDGHAELYIPFIFDTAQPRLTIAYLGFRLGQDYRTKAKALKAMLEATWRLKDHFDCDVRVVTKAEYPMGRWALKHGFTQKQDGFYLEKH